MSTDTRRSRESDLEILRLLASGMVIVHHFCLAGGIPLTSGFNHYLLIFLEGFNICAVDIFLLISGYFLIRSKSVSLWKPIKLLVLVSVLGAASLLIRSVMTLASGGTPALSVKSVVSAVLPNSYYVTFYCVLIILAPFLNHAFLTLDKTGRRRLILILVLLFSVWTTVVDGANEIIVAHGISRVDGISTVLRDGSDYGYTIVNFVLLYLLGGYIRLNEDKLAKIPTWKLLLGQSSILVILFVWNVLTYKNDFELGTAMSYCNPLVIGESVILFTLFRRIRIGSVRIINELAGASLTAYLVHVSFILRIAREGGVGERSTLSLLGYIVMWVIILYLGSFVIYKVYSFVERAVFGRLEEKYGSLTICVE